MKAKIFFITVYILIITVVQSTVLDYFRVFGVKPNLLVVFIICFSLIRGDMTEGAAVGFFAGLAQDMVTGKVLGLYSLLGMFLGLVLSSVNRRLYRDNVIVIIFFTLIASAIYESVLMLYVYVKQPFNLLEALRYRILPVTIYNSVVSILFYVLSSKLNKRFESYNKTSRKY
jgi:rod shape-determining protein MreD